MIADRLCPECHGYPEVVAAQLDRFVWCCAVCGHRWNEPRELVETTGPNGETILRDRVRFVGRGGWVRFE